MNVYDINDDQERIFAINSPQKIEERLSRNSVPHQSESTMDKQMRAEKLRRELEELRVEQSKKEREKFLAAREKVDQKRAKMEELLKNKELSADARYESHINQIRQKAKVESDKANEVAFIQMLENQNRKITFDERLQETAERKKEIEDRALAEKIKYCFPRKQQNFFSNNRNRKVKEEEVKKKRKEFEVEKQLKMKQSQIKRDEADFKRFRRLEEEKKKYVDELMKVSRVVQDKKDQTQMSAWEIKVNKIKSRYHKQSDIDSMNSDQVTSDEDQIEYRSCRSLEHAENNNININIVFFNIQDKNTQIVQHSDNTQKKKKKKFPKKSPKPSPTPKYFRSLSEPPLIFHNGIFQLNRQTPTRSIRLLPLIRKIEYQSVNYYRLCQICNIMLPEEESDQIHLSSKVHKQTKILYNLISNTDDILTIKGRREEELTNNRFNILRKRCQKIKLTIQKKSLLLENRNIYAVTKETMSTNKQRIQKICNELDKQLSNQIKDLYVIENLFMDLIKVLDCKTTRDLDLTILRQVKFIPIVIELFKKVPACRKKEYANYLAIIGNVTQLLYLFCQIYDNRTYFIVGNRILPIIEFLYSFLATKPTKFIYGFHFVPQLFQILGVLIKHQLPKDPMNDLDTQEIQEDLIEYMFCSGMFHKMKLRFQCFEKDYINSEGKIPLALVKSVSLLEAVTNYHGFDISSKPVYESPSKPNKSFQRNITFVLDETDMFGIIHLMSQMIVGEGVSLKNNRMLQQTTLSFLQLGIKTLNNIARLSLEIFQKHMNSSQNRQETHMIMISLLNYCKECMGTYDDLRDLMNELILMIGYYCILNGDNQGSLLSGVRQISILHNLCDLPPHFYIDRNLINVLFPTLICCVFRNPRNMEVVLDENSKDYFIKFIAKEFKEVLFTPQPPPYNQIDHDYEEKTLNRSPSMTSTNSSQNSSFPHSSSNYYKFSHRFPPQLLIEALKEFTEFQDQK